MYFIFKVKNEIVSCRGNSSGHTSEAIRSIAYVWEGYPSLVTWVRIPPSDWLMTGEYASGQSNRRPDATRNASEVRILSLLFGWNSVVYTKADGSKRGETRWVVAGSTPAHPFGVAESPIKLHEDTYLDLFDQNCERIVAHWQSIRCEENHWNNGFTRQFTTWHINRRVVGSSPIVGFLDRMQCVRSNFCV